MGAGDVKKGLGGQIAHLRPISLAKEARRWWVSDVLRGGRALLKSNLSALAVPVHAGVGGGLRHPLVSLPAV
jgi:hypothetical protein